MIFTGYYGMGNFGDDLFGHAVLHGAWDWWKRQASVLGPPLEGADPSAFVLRGGLQSRYFAQVGVLGKGARLMSKMVAPLGHDYLVYGGGSVFSFLKSWDVRQAYAAAARLNLLTLAAVGVSVGPFRSLQAEHRVIEKLGTLRYIALRDDDSFGYVDALGLDAVVVRAADLAGTLPESEFPRGDRLESGVLGVNVCPALLGMGSEDAALTKIATALERQVIRRGIHIRLLSLQAHPTSGDAPAVERLRQLLPRGATSVVSYDGNAKRMWRAIGECQYIISARLHGAISAYLQGVPLIMLGYHAKCAAFAADVGLAESSYVRADTCGLANMDEAVEALIMTHAPPRLDPAIYRAKAALNFSQAPWSAT